jgi:aminopeptidase N
MQRTRLLRFANILLLLVAVVHEAELFSQQREVEDLDAYYRSEARSYAARMLMAESGSASGNDIDVSYYRLNLALNPASNTLNGSLFLLSIALAPIQSITLDLSSALIVDSVRIGNRRIVFQQQSATVLLSLDRTYQSGEKVSAEIFYRGSPVVTGFGSFAFSTQQDGSPWIWSLSEPYGAREWWPCKDQPTDKADSVDIILTCDAALTAVSQGKLISVVDNGNNTRTFFWKHRYPIATYLVSLAVARYDLFSNWFRYSPTDSMEVVNYVLPSLSPSSRNNLSLAPAMLGIYSNLFGLYPFVKEKYGHAQFGWGGGMEHQTITSLGNFSEGVVAHELAHQWFGDMITMGRWRDIWLNEGFATYCVALYNERQVGLTSYRNYMNSQMSSALLAAGTVSVSDTSNINRLFDNNLVYAKGATVLHMLRHVLGDSVFLAGMKAYANDARFRFQTSSTEGLRSVFESVSGKDLSFFFNEWIYGEQYPKYTISWAVQSLSNAWWTSVRIRQTTGTNNPTFFTMPIDLRFTGPSLDTLVIVWNRSNDTTYSFLLPRAATSLQIDPDNWILKSVSTSPPTAGGRSSGAPDVFSLSNYPNPFNPSTIIEFTIPKASRVMAEIFNDLGETIEKLVDEHYGPGTVRVQWTPRVGSGVYFCKITATPESLPAEKFQAVRKMLFVK